MIVFVGDKRKVRSFDRCSQHKDASAQRLGYYFLWRGGALRRLTSAPKLEQRQGSQSSPLHLCDVNSQSSCVAWIQSYHRSNVSTIDRSRRDDPLVLRRLPDVV